MDDQQPIIRTCSRCKQSKLVADFSHHPSYCKICYRELDKKVERADMSLDHVIPIAKGGLHCASNIRLAHVICNKRKCKQIIAIQPEER